MIEKIIINNKEINVNSCKEEVYSHKYSSEKTTLFINNFYYLKTIDFIQYICDKCGKNETKRYAYNYNKYHQNKILCGECLKKKSRLEKYGVENFFQNKNIHNKAKQKRAKPEVQERIEQTRLEKYGDVNPFKFQSKKFKQSMKKIYGVEHPMYNEFIKEKFMGSISHKDYKKIQNKTRDTMIKKYGVEYSTQLNSMKDKSQQTMLKRYGVKHISQHPEFHKKQMSSFGRKMKLKEINENLHYQTQPELECIIYHQNNNINIWDGPSIPYMFEGKEHIYHIDFETDKYIIEIKSSHGWYRENLVSGKIDAKNKAAQKYAASIGKEFKFMLDTKDYSSLGSKFLQE